MVLPDASNLGDRAHGAMDRTLFESMRTVRADHPRQTVVSDSFFERIKSMSITRLAGAIVAAALLALAGALPAQAQNFWYTPAGSGANGAVGMCLNASSQAVPCSDPSALPSPSSNQAATIGGAIAFHLVAAATNNATLISTGKHTVYAAQLGGIGAAPAYLKIYDKATSPTCGTDTPIKTLIIPAASTAANGAGSNIMIPLGAKISNGLGICVVTGIADSDNTAVAAATFVINLDYQ